MEEIYDKEHKENALDLIKKIVWFRKNYIKSIISIFKQLNIYNNNISLNNNPFVSYISYLTNIKRNIDINNFPLDSLLEINFNFLFGRWLNSDNDLKEPLSKFFRDIYEQITDPHIYSPMMKDIDKK